MNDLLISEMIRYYSGDAKRIQHFLKVYMFAAMIGRMENLDSRMQHILETAAIVHDIGIKLSEEKYQSSAGSYQEMEGPALAEAMLKGLGYDDIVIERVCYLVGHHHTYNNIDGTDYQILVEADFLVNLYEDDSSAAAVCSVQDKIFRTSAGKKLLEEIYKNAFSK